MNDLAKQTDRTMGEVLEETILHSFEPSTACLHSNATLRLIEKLKKKHGLDYDVHANYRFAE